MVVVRTLRGNMVDWKHSVATAASDIAKRFDRLRFDLKLRTGRLDPIEYNPEDP